MEIHHDHEIAIPPRDDAHSDCLSMSDVHPPSIATTFNNRPREPSIHAPWLVGGL